MRSLSVLVKPSSHKCNIDCKYCFYKDEAKLRKQNNNDLMSTETLELLVRRAFEFADESVTFVFQGGEPTLMGIPFYEQLTYYVKKYNTRGAEVQFSIQTNGMLLDENWCKFLKKHAFLVGLSFDGMPSVHDKYRTDYQGNGTAKYAVNAIREMQKTGVDYNVLMVVTRESVNQVEDCYHYLKNLGVEYLQIIPVLDPYGERRGKQTWSLTGQDLQTFLIRLFDVWYSDFLHQRELRVTYFENIIYKMMGNFHCSCAMNGQCMLEMVIESDGSVYPCDFYVADEWEMGNIRNMSFVELISTKTAANFIAESIQVNTGCLLCQWRGYCQGACRRYQLTGVNEYENYYCMAYKAFFDHAGEEMKLIASHLLD